MTTGTPSSSLEGVNSNDETSIIVESGYDRIADTYLKWSRERKAQDRDQLIDKVISLLTPGASVLELGCGAGIPITQHLVANKLQVTGIDISISQINLARIHVPGAKFVHANMISNDFESKLRGKEASSLQYDAIIAMYSIFHIPLHLQEDMLIKMIGWLRPGGLLLFNHNADEGENHYDNWMGAPMFSCSPGVKGIRDQVSRQAHTITILEDKVIAEAVGKNHASFHYILVQKNE